VALGLVLAGLDEALHAADRLVVAAAIVVGLLSWTRDPLARALYRSHLRRRWALACRHASLATRNDRIPRTPSPR
jgi:hypothetical protein